MKSKTAETKATTSSKVEKTKVKDNKTTKTTTTTTTTNTNTNKSKVTTTFKFNKKQMAQNDKYKELEMKCNVPKEGWPVWRKHLYDHGWAVVPKVIGKDQCQIYKDQFWQWLASFGTGIKKDSPETWKSSNWPNNIHGIFQHYSFGQEQVCWNIRQEPEIIKVFQQIYQDKELLVSFDGGNLSKPTSEGMADKAWQHFDQGYNKQGFRCVQGFLNLDVCKEYDGGLIVYQDSHKKHDEYFMESGEVSTGDWYRFDKEPNDMKWFKDCKKVKVCCDIGDVVLWDSRTIHYACPPILNKGTGNCRAVIYVSYQPASLATPESISKKQQAFNTKRMTSHWAAEVKLFPKSPRTYGDEERANKFRYDEKTLPQLSEVGRKLAGLDPY